MRRFLQHIFAKNKFFCGVSKSALIVFFTVNAFWSFAQNCPGPNLTVGACQALGTAGSNTDYWNAAAGCNAQDRDDSWATFVATSTSTTITYSSAQDAILHLFAGACNVNAVALACSDVDVANGVESITYTTTIGATYRVRVQRYYSDANMTGTICVFNNPNPYCISYPGSFGFNDGITNVTFNGITTINNTTSANNGNEYNDYTASQNANVYPGRTYTLSASVNTAGNFTQQQVAWIDWDKNNVFNTYERYDLGTATNVTNGLSSLCPLSITVPNNAVLGVTRMRVMTIFSGNNSFNDPCLSFTPTTPYDGETEDYSITVIAPPACSGAPGNSVASSSTGQVLPLGTFTLSASLLPFTGYTYQWQSGPSATGPWANIAGGTTNPYVATAPGTAGITTYYQLVVTCSNGGLSTASNPVAVTTVNAVPCTPTHTTDLVNNTISVVEFVGTQNDIINNSGTSNISAYQDFTGLANRARQEQGEPVNLNVFSAAASTYWKAWVDWNKDGTFQDPGEMVYSSGGTVTLSTTLGFQIPLATAPGFYRIRIRTQDYNGCFFGGPCGSNTLTPCTNMQDGQAEDYLFEVISRCNASVTKQGNDTVCSNSPVAITISAEGTTATTGFNWYANQSGGSPLASTPASGAPPAASWTTPSINSTTTYWVTATGTNTASQPCESFTRVPIIAYKPPLATINFVGGNPVYWCSGGTSINVTGSSGTIENKLIDVDFENGTLGEFTVSNIGTLTDPVNQPWVVRNSIFVPTMSAVWKPAVSSGFGANKFAFALSDISGSGLYHTFLTSAAHNTTGYSNLRLDFRMYFDHYLPDGQGGIIDTVTVQASNNNGASWNTLQSFIGDQGKASNFADFSYNLAASYNNQANVRVRFVFGANWTNGVAIDSVRLSGTTTASSNYVWTPVNGNSGGNLYLPPYPPGTPYAGQNVSNIVVAPTPAQLSAGDPLDFEAALILGNGCVAKDTITVIIDNNMWLGYSADWNSNANWCGGIPIFGSKVFIPTTPVGGNMPIIYSPTTGTATSVTIDNGATLTINNGASLQLKRDLDTYVGGTFTNNGTLELMGDNVFTQNFPGPGTIAPMNNLTIDYSGSLSVILNAPISITGRLKPKQGTLFLGEDSITLKSNATTTAYVDTVKSAAGFTYGSAGRFVVERYIKYFKNWNLLSSPTAEAQTIRQSWQENGVNNAGYGTIITGPSPLGTGLDAVSPLPSMKWYNPNIDTFKAVNNTTLTTTDSLVNRNTGYFLFVRGDRSVGVGGAGNNTTLRSKGKIYIGSTGGTPLPPPAVSFTGLTTGEFISIGNPFASVIDPTVTSATNLKPAYTVWDPSATGNFNAGSYLTFSQSTGWIGTPTPSSPYPTGVYKSIQSGQAYLMEVNTGGGNVSVGFEENDKNNSTINTVTRVTEMPADLVMMSTMLHSNAGLVADGNRVSFNSSYSNAIGNEDATKLMNSGENFGILVQGQKLIIDGRKPVSDADTIFYYMSGLRIQNYMLSFEPVNLFAPGLNAELIDQYLGSRTNISLTDSSFYYFSATSDPQSRAANRFYLVFKAPAAPVPVTFVAISASRNTDRSIKVTWRVENEINIAHYEIERSADGIQFNGILSADVTNSNSYNRNDLSPLAFDNYYRIKAVGINGEITYSAIVKVLPENLVPSVSVVPNPVKGKQMQVRFTGVKEGKYTLILQNESGQRIYREVVNLGGSYEVRTIRLKKTVAAGAYFIKLQNSDKEIIAVEKLFIE